MSDVATTDTRPFFMDIWREHRFRADLVARRAGVLEETVLTMLRFQPVEARDAASVLAILSHLYQQEYTTDWKGRYSCNNIVMHLEHIQTFFLLIRRTKKFARATPLKEKLQQRGYL